MPENDLQNTPHFSRGGPAHAAAGAVWLLLDLALPPAVFILSIFAVRLLPLEIRHAAHPAVWLTIAALVAGAVLWNRALHAVHTIRRSNDLSSLPFTPDERHRVRVVCWPDELERLSAVTADSFEPERFRAVLPDARIIDITRPGQLAALVGAPRLVVQLLVIHPIASGVTMVVLALTALFLLRLPTYVRLSPRRLEIIRYAPISTRPVHRQMFSLAGPVTVSTKGLGQIAWSDEQGKKRRLPLRLILGGNEAARAALAAALSTAETPEPESL